jgi:hypothetical protein
MRYLGQLTLAVEKESNSERKFIIVSLIALLIANWFRVFVDDFLNSNC